MEPLSILAGLTIGMHMATVHIPHRDYQNDINPGMYVQHTETGLTVGAYHNTLRRTSVYVTKSFNTGKLFGMQTNVMLGGITGYKRIESYNLQDDSTGHPVWVTFEEGVSKHSVAPMLAASIELPSMQGVTPRITLVPPSSNAGSTALHFSMEHKF